MLLLLVFSDGGVVGAVGAVLVVLLVLLCGCVIGVAGC